MKFAFVGKGGSGKSTLTSLFIRYLQTNLNRSVLAIDADLNMNLSGLLGVQTSADKLLANPQVSEAIRQYLKGTNPRLQDISKFLPTTPPGTGSNLVSSANESALAPYAVQVSSTPLVNLLTVGTYDQEGIGQTCYHSYLFVAENLLSHTVTTNDFNVVCDMVAGTDAFAYSMHLQFDAIVLIAEPTPESVEVCELYLGLAKDSGIDELIHIVGNKVADDEDLKFITKRLGKQPLGAVPLLASLKKARQRGETITANHLEPPVSEVMRQIELSAKSSALRMPARMNMLHQLHEKLNTKKWVQLGYGDVLDQIDPQFSLQSLDGLRDQDTHESVHKHKADEKCTSATSMETAGVV